MLLIHDQGSKSNRSQAIVWGAFVSITALATWINSPPATATTFVDTQGHWAELFIDALSSRGVIQGFPDGTFRPDQFVTRAQFATIVTQAFSLPISAGLVTFRDVSPSYWAASAISTAAANNLVAGFPDGTFRPEQPVTRTETWVVLSNGLPSNTIPATQVDLFSRYRDAAAIPTWAVSAVSRASQANLIVNYPDPTLLEPNRAATRAEVAAFTYQTLLARNQNTPNTWIGQVTPTPDFNLQVVTVTAGTVTQIMTNLNEPLYIAPNETRPFSVIVSNPIRNPQGEVLVPFGSRIDGRFEPAPGGTRFVADSIVINEQLYSLSAQSEVIQDIKDPRHTNTGQVIQDAAIGAAAGAILGLVTGDQVIATEEVLAGGAAGAVIGNTTAPQVVLIQPQQGINLQFTQDLVINR